MMKSFVEKHTTSYPLCKDEEDNTLDFLSVVCVVIVLGIPVLGILGEVLC